jgi:hypothetical protein
MTINATNLAIVALAVFAALAVNRMLKLDQMLAAA